ncbi:hypothetical protein K437DRAFT_148766 [Tilletiaria anomala UBC 951]|uniref:Uncharacterized protein n=1 Tax=Tilletiaria anomala (strain ATCC 24038 / CBS 436.72 / UBC 951) TaxID=1037660 RepID=A0A066WGA3_TILAU|nr:uncharacterized protein K437DRAFT_148766 [Tilletiaria anomala UBC 951]KDN52806.1 hypothetical protein K437DRAFT_148766 [Tilletiaria anomala UBC 951]
MLYVTIAWAHELSLDARSDGPCVRRPATNCPSRLERCSNKKRTTAPVSAAAAMNQASLQETSPQAFRERVVLPCRSPFWIVLSSASCAGRLRPQRANCCCVLSAPSCKPHVSNIQGSLRSQGAVALHPSIIPRQLQIDSGTASRQASQLLLRGVSRTLR